MCVYVYIYIYYVCIYIYIIYTTCQDCLSERCPIPTDRSSLFHIVPQWLGYTAVLDNKKTPCCPTPMNSSGRLSLVHQNDHMGLSENVVYPEKPNGFADHYPYEKWLFHWGYSPFSDIPIYWKHSIFQVLHPLDDCYIAIEHGHLYQNCPARTWWIFP